MSVRVLFLALAFAAACSSPPADDAPESSADALSTLAPGHYTLAEDSLDLSGLWIDDVVLHHDGSYDAVFGTDISNVSGHQFSQKGKYQLVTFKAGPSITFDRSSFIEFTYRVQSDGTVKVRHLDGDPELQTKFTLKKAR